MGTELGGLVAICGLKRSVGGESGVVTVGQSAALNTEQLDLVAAVG